ncbi:hypothetical protein RI129_004845 [Pyrocoelia pectoralis]|uniref:Uncharacterized protein n=1 Tax=Pyrocoelia pectoralis TaxID=417401 RepID=A0AAN7VK01_9COLE
MGRLLPVTLAVCMNANGIYIFRAPENIECFPTQAYFMFLLAVFYLLWDIPLNPYPSCFRGLVKPVSVIIEFLVAVVMIEFLMADFWCPLQAKFVAFVPKIPDYINDAMNTIGVDAGNVTDYLEILKSEEALIASSYTLSAFFLLSILHACRVVDYRLLRCGVETFAVDIKKRTTKFAIGLLPITSQEMNRRRSRRRGSNSSESSFELENE